MSNAESAFKNQTHLTDVGKQDFLARLGKDLYAFSQQLVLPTSTFEWRVSVLSINTGYTEEFCYLAIGTFFEEIFKGKAVIF